jgi:hypothetical protein
MEPFVSVEQIPISRRELAFSLLEAPENGWTLTRCSTEVAFSVKEMGISVTETAVPEPPEGISGTAEGFAVMAEGSDFTRWAIP